jgi:hypothetical protein
MTRARDIADRNVDSTTIDGVDSTQLLRSDVADTKTAGDLSFADSLKAQFGASNDLQIFHDSSHSYIQDTSTGDLRLTSNGSGVMITKTTTENMARFLTDGAVELYYDGGTYTTPKLATTSTGIDVTGTVTADGLTVNTGTTDIATRFESTDGTAGIALSDNAGSVGIFTRDTGDFSINVGGDASSSASNASEAIRIDSSGNLLVGNTSNTTSQAGVYLNSNGRFFATHSGSSSIFNRLSSDGDILLFQKDTTTVGSIGTEGGNLYIDGSPATGKTGIEFLGSAWFPRDGGANSDNAVDLGDSTNRFRDGYFAGDIFLGDQILHDGDTNTYLRFNAADQFQIFTGGGNRLQFNSTEAVFNESSNDYDFRVESNGATHMLFVDAGNNAVGINESSPQATNALTVRSDGTAARVISTSVYNSVLKVKNGVGGVDSNATIHFQANDADEGFISFVKVAANHGKMEFNLRNGGTRYNTLTLNPGVESVFNDGSADMDFRVESNANTHMLFVDAGGESVSFGTSNATVAQSNVAGGLSYKPAAQLEVSGNTTQAAFFNRTDTGNLIGFLTGGSSVGAISVTGSGTTYHTTSDRRLKENIEPLVATDKLMAMNPVSYTWKAFPDEPRSMGFIAQEMAEVMPEAVATNEHNDMMSMDYGRITPVLVAALQDAHRKIEQLEQRIAEMENG